MAFAFSASTNGQGNSTSFSTGIPSVNIGDILLVQISLNNTDVITSEPTILTLLDNNTTTSAQFPNRFYYGIVDGVNISSLSSLSWTLSATRAWNYNLYAVSGADTNTPIAGFHTTGAVSSTVVMPSLTTTGSSWLVEIGSAKSNGTAISSWVPPAGWTVETLSPAFNTFAGSSFFADRSAGAAAPGTYGGETYTSNAAPSVFVSYIVALNPLATVITPSVAWFNA